jgi:hypothetical protein
MCEGAEEFSSIDADPGGVRFHLCGHLDSSLRTACYEWKVDMTIWLRRPNHSCLDSVYIMKKIMGVFHHTLECVLSPLVSGQQQPLYRTEFYEDPTRFLYSEMQVIHWLQHIRHGGVQLPGAAPAASGSDRPHRYSSSSYSASYCHTLSYVANCVLYWQNSVPFFPCSVSYSITKLCAILVNGRTSWMPLLVLSFHCL